jgi:hypothetical protein
MLKIFQFFVNEEGEMARLFPSRESVRSHSSDRGERACEAGLERIFYKFIDNKKIEWDVTEPRSPITN